MSDGESKEKQDNISDIESEEKADNTLDSERKDLVCDRKTYLQHHY